MKSLRKIISALCFITLAAPMTAQAIAVDAADRGWYRYNYSNGQIEASAGNINYLAGLGLVSANALGAYRNYFAFDLGAYAGQTFSAATLSIYNPKAGDPNGSPTIGGFYQTQAAANAAPYETYELRQISSDIGNLLNASAGWTGFNDLGDGLVFGSYTATLLDNGTFIEIVLNNAGLAALNEAVGGMFVLGGRLNSVDLNLGAQTLFGYSNQNNLADTQLILTQAVSEPESIALLLAGLGMISFVARRRKTAIR
jgi:hypothetical protein